MMRILSSPQTTSSPAGVLQPAKKKQITEKIMMGLHKWYKNNIFF
jgi:hypothetical protein